MENQNNQLQKKEAQNNQLSEIKPKLNLCAAMVAGNNRQVAQILKQYKLPTGEVNFPAICSTVPSEERLPAIYQKDFMQATALVVGALTMAFEKMNFKRKMDGILINNIAEEVLDDCDVDNLSLEDLLLFLQMMVRGRYGNIEELSVSRFMNLFDKFRDERHKSFLNYTENLHLHLKGLGSSERSSKSDALSEHFSRFANTMSTMRQNIKELKNDAKSD